MNWIGHYLCALPQPPLLRAGSVLADLVGILDRKLKPRNIKRWVAQSSIKPSDEVLALLNGMVWHEEIDRHFHRQNFFVRTQSTLFKTLLQANGPAKLKRLLPAHVLAEFWFDCYLVTQHPAVLVHIQHVLQQAHEPLQAMLLCAPHIQCHDVLTLQKRIEHSNFGQDFCCEQGPLRRMNRMLPRFGMRVLTPQEEKATYACWISVKMDVSAHLDDFVMRMQRLALTQGCGLTTR